MNFAKSIAIVVFVILVLCFNLFIEILEIEHEDLEATTERSYHVSDIVKINLSRVLHRIETYKQSYIMLTQENMYDKDKIDTIVYSQNNEMWECHFIGRTEEFPNVLSVQNYKSLIVDGKFYQIKYDVPNQSVSVYHQFQKLENGLPLDYAIFVTFNISEETHALKESHHFDYFNIVNNTIIIIEENGTVIEPSFVSNLIYNSNLAQRATEIDGFYVSKQHSEMGVDIIVAIPSYDKSYFSAFRLVDVSSYVITISLLLGCLLILIRKSSVYSKESDRLNNVVRMIGSGDLSTKDLLFGKLLKKESSEKLFRVDKDLFQTKNDVMVFREKMLNGSVSDYVYSGYKYHFIFVLEVTNVFDIALTRNENFTVNSFINSFSFYINESNGLFLNYVGSLDFKRVISFVSSEAPLTRQDLIAIHNRLSDHSSYCHFRIFALPVSMQDKVDISVYKLLYAFTKHDDDILVCQEKFFDIETDVSECSLKLPSALENDELSLVYQPVINIKSERIVSLESLLRWDKTNDQVSPSQLIDMFYMNGGLGKLTEFIVKKVFIEARKFELLGRTDLKISINLSEKQLLEKKLISIVNKHLTSSLVKPEMIEFEVSESIAMKRNIQVLENLINLSNLGFGVVVDDMTSPLIVSQLSANVNITGVKINSMMISNKADMKIMSQVKDNMAGKSIDVVIKMVENLKSSNNFRDRGFKLMQGNFYQPFTSTDKIYTAYLSDSRVKKYRV
ncbi:EAL domain-containing protein [Vibrio metschnikovii]|uniref:EAL domain-containing protein n=1 Tax=Vibrio metschnikovii TaxID=28172 RepID=A0A9X0UI32_VIBME|nr:EAL domain-containing protein [Vibrio metschnikovii]MBC5851465.1 EAL domain-containing protein [Vibrio metschnikovii]